MYSLEFFAVHFLVVLITVDSTHTHDYARVSKDSVPGVLNCSTERPGRHSGMYSL